LLLGSLASTDPRLAFLEGEHAVDATSPAVVQLPPYEGNRRRQPQHKEQSRAERAETREPFKPGDAGDHKPQLFFCRELGSPVHALIGLEEETSETRARM